jgi:D-beta-D-heptose 7-phosphate kinase/D-beta-D-heptose 1-phosphate adenosyltransferase
MLDRYVFGTVTRISPEAPVPVISVNGERSVPGGAANVALNIAALGGQASIVGIVGHDKAGAELLGLLRDSGISVKHVLEAPGIQTTVKTRVIAERQQVVRVDREDPPEAVLAHVGSLCDCVREAVRGSAGLVVEDYGKGVICQPVVDAAMAAAAELRLPAGLDPKDNHDLAIRGLALATPNYKEACGAAGVPVRDVGADLAPGGRLPRIAEALLEKWRAELVAVTLGAHGMYLAPRGGDHLHIPTLAREVFDVSGAGDTVIGAAMLALAAGSSHVEACSIANHAAGVVVGKIGTATCSPEELLAGME